MAKSKRKSGKIRQGKAGADNQKSITNKKSLVWLENLIYLVVIALLFLAVYAYTFDKKLDLNGDNAYYYVLGKALSMGEGYVNIANINKGPNNHYPPGYPFILSIFMHISESTTFLKLINGLFLFLSLYLIYYFFLKLTENHKISFISVLFLTVNAHLLQYGFMMMSEISFLLFSFLTIFLIDRMEKKGSVFKKPYIYLALITLVLSYYIRATGLALFGGIILYLIIRKNWKPVVFLSGGFILGILPWFLRSQKLGGGSYIKPLIMINPYRPELGRADFGDYVSRFIDNLSRYITREIPDAAFPFFEVNYLEKISVSEWLIGLILFSVSIYGFYRIRKKGLLIICYLLGTFGILLFWPEVWRGVRFVLPVMPFLLLSIIIGGYHLINRFFDYMKLKIRFNILYAGILVLAFMGPVKILHERAADDYNASWKNYFQIADYFRMEKIKDVVVICRKPMLFHIRSGTYTANYAYLQDENEMIEDLKSKQASFVVLDNLGYRQTYEYLFPVINNNRDIFQIVLHLPNPDTYLLTFNPEN